MKKATLITVVVFLLISALNLNADNELRDIYGFKNLRWGMTENEILNLLGKKVKKRKVRYDEIDNNYSGLELQSVKIGETELRASLWMDDNSNKLKSIVFVPRDQTAMYEWAEAFINLEKYLVDFYGDPDIEETSNDLGTSAVRKWNFPSTEIDLSYLKLQDSELLLLVYSQIAKGN